MNRIVPRPLILARAAQLRTTCAPVTDYRAQLAKEKGSRYPPDAFA